MTNNMTSSVDNFRPKNLLELSFQEEETW